MHLGGTLFLMIIPFLVLSMTGMMLSHPYFIINFSTSMHPHNIATKRELVYMCSLEEAGGFGMTEKVNISSTVRNSA